MKLLPRVMLERNIESHPVAYHLAVFYRYILLHHFTNTKILDALCSGFYGLLGDLSAILR